ncbi:MAG: hypothetical protein ACD_77C00203G0002 [uncultured bacterium]|nr:MAG: hypothetical protein ACD_77C00203G0002 [uncultured bacterium]HBY02870.1 TonB-dependent receptor [Rikenellaceae bacterium]
MNKSIIASLILFFAFTGINAQAQERIKLVNINSDSLSRFVLKHTGKDLFFKPAETGDSLIVSIECSSRYFMKELAATLKKQDYSIDLINNSYIVLKGKGISSGLPDDFFAAETDIKKESEYVKAVTFEENTAKSENKIYIIGNPNFPSAENRVLLSGYVRNYDSGEPIAGVSVMLENPQTVAVTDAFGFYRITVPKGEGVIEIKGYGLNDSRLMLNVFGSGDLDIVMKDKVYALKGVVLTAESNQKMRSTQIGIEKVRIDRIKHIPSAFGEADVLKIVLTLPGVKSVGESSGGFNVRGGASDQNLILFNEGTIYNPTHLFGLFSAFNPDVVSDIELYKSTIPAKFGGRISSVLEINSRNGNSNKITGSAGLGLLTSKFHIEGPIVKGRTNFITGIRTTYSNWLLGLLPEGNGYRDGKASFHDITMGLNHKVDEHNTLYLYGYYSGDNFSFSADTTYGYKNLNASLKWRRIIDDRRNMVLSAGYDQYGYNNKEKGNPVNAYEMSFRINQIYFKTNFNWLIHEKHSVNYGINALYLDLNPGTMNPLGGESIVVPRQIDYEKGAEISLYGSDTWSISDKLTLDLGLRYTLYSALKSGSFKPYHGPEFRLSARYALNDNFSLKGGVNTMRQNIHMLSNTTTISPTDIWKLSDENIVPQTGWQAAIGLYNNILNRRVELSLEGYYKGMNNYLDYKSGAVLNMNENIEQDVIKTTGRAFGVELMAKKPFGKLNGWIAYTYSRTLLRESGEKELYNINGGNWYPASYDKPHDLKIIGNYKFTQRFSISVNLDYATGRPVTIPVSKYHYGGGFRLYYSQRNEYRIPDYFRMDFAVNIEPSHNLTLWTHSTITIGVYNITGRQNAFSVFYTTNEGNKVQGYQLSIFGAPIPYVNYNIKF